MPAYLPNTALTTNAIGLRIYVYAQAYHGALIEAKGGLGDNQDNNKANVFIADGQETIGITTRWRAKILQRGAPKLFTPIAAAAIRSTRFVMFLDDKNILHDVRYQNENEGWVRGNLSTLGVECAHYSKLASSTVFNGQQTFICLYYQKNEFHGPITMVSYAELSRSWVKGKPDMTVTPPATPPPAPTYRDPPMYGTSMTAVKPRGGIGPRSQRDDKLPVLYLQWDTHSIAHARGDAIGPIPGLEHFTLSPHTSLTAVDDPGSDNLLCFYITNDNSVRMVKIDGDSATRVIDRVVSPTPRSSIAAVLPRPDRIVLFYQLWDKDDSEKVNIYAKTIEKQGPLSWFDVDTTDLMDE